MELKKILSKREMNALVGGAGNEPPPPPYPPPNSVVTL